MMFDSQLLAVLECPRDHSELRFEGGDLTCAHGHRYPVVNGVPVFLLAERKQTIGIAKASLAAAESGVGGPLYLDTIGVSDDQRREIEKDWQLKKKIDPAVRYLIAATGGYSYVDLIGHLDHYLVPDIPLENGAGELLLDIGSNWGRWSEAATRKGWKVIAIDPSLGALMAARRAFSASNFSCICGDARFLPFKHGTFKGVFSYSVIQHFSEEDAETAIAEVGRVLKGGGRATIQMASKGGLRSRYILATRNDDGAFRVRYWSLAGLRNVFEQRIGPTEIKAEAFGGLGLLYEDRRYVSARARLLIYVSQALKRSSVLLKPLNWFADSVYVSAVKR
jgi:SAM-dependent methyltransferase